MIATARGAAPVRRGDRGRGCAHPGGAGRRGRRGAAARRRRRARRDTSSGSPQLSAGSASTVSHRKPMLERAVDHVGQRRFVDAAAHDGDVTRHLVQVDVGRGGHSRTLPNSHHYAAFSIATPPFRRYAAFSTLRSRPDAPGPRALDRDREPGGRARSGPGPPPPRARRARRRRSATCEIVLSADAADLVALARDAFGRGRAVVACGGDGTVCMLAGVAADEGGVLGIVPLGSGQRLRPPARHPPRRSRSPPSTSSAPARCSPADLGRADTADGASTWFTTVANTGFDAVANALGQRRHLDERHAAVRARHVAHARDVPADAGARHRRRRPSSRATRGWSRSGNTRTYAERHDDHARRRACTTACSTCASSAGVARRVPAHVPEGVQWHATSSTPRCSRGAGRSVVVEAPEPRTRGRALGERRARGPAAGSRS